MDFSRRTQIQELGIAHWSKDRLWFLSHPPPTAYVVYVQQQHLPAALCQACLERNVALGVLVVLAGLAL